MSHITEQDVEKISQLARLELTAAERQKFGGQLARILDYIDQLNEVEIAGVEPFLPEKADERAFRADTLKTALPRESVLQNAPQANSQFFQVPAVIK